MMEQAPPGTDYVIADGAMFAHRAPRGASRWVTTECGVELFATTILAGPPHVIPVCGLCTGESGRGPAFDWGNGLTGEHDRNPMVGYGGY